MEIQINEVEVCTDETTESVELQNNAICSKSGFDNNVLQSSQKTEIIPKENDVDVNKSIISKVGESYLCPECKHTFIYLQNLKRHVNDKHPSLLFSLFPSIKRSHKCNVCEKYFKSMRSLQAHSRRFHRQYTKIKQHKCPLCPHDFQRRNFSEHFEKSHNMMLKSVKLNFDSYEDFCEWKKAIERVTKSYFRKQNTRETNGIIRHIFICHRSGTYISAASENKRKLKAQGSRKIDAYCPATMKAVVVKEGKCEVAFQSQHLGHENELQHLNLTYDERIYIADKLASNLSLSDILNDIRNSASKDGSPRLCLLTRKDLYNIRSSFLKDKQLYSSTMTSNEKLTNDLSDIHNKHSESEQIRADITKIEKGWVLTSSEHNEIYLIKENSKSCDCPLICSYCKVCINSYICSCSDSSVKGNMCKHIHFFCIESNKRQVVHSKNDSLDNNDVIKATSNSKRCDNLQTNNISSTVSTKRKKPYINFVNSEKRDILKNKFSNLIDSIKTEKEYILFQNTIEELTAKLKPIQVHSPAKCNVVTPTTNHLLKSIPVSKNLQDQQNSKSQKTVYKPLLLQILSPLKQDGNTCYLHFAKSENQILLLKNK